MRIGPHQEARTRRARQAFRVLRGEKAEAERAAAIDALPVVVRGRTTLRQVRCCGETGRGPHVQNVPEAVLWSLIDVQRYRCPFHR